MNSILFLLSNTLKNKILKDKHRLNIIDTIKIGNEYVLKKLYEYHNLFGIISREEGIHA
jgi:hypothetical protein